MVEKEFMARVKKFWHEEYAGICQLPIPPEREIDT